MSQKTKQPKRSPGTDALRESMTELEGYVKQGMTIDDIGRHIKQHSLQRVHTYSWSAPSKHSPKSVKKLRSSLGLSQAVFAQLLGVSAILVQSWERGVRTPSPLACRLLDIISKDPAAWIASLRPTVKPSPRPRRAG
jgi:DNA-binding transcriptional regulator YiaG